MTDQKDTYITINEMIERDLNNKIENEKTKGEDELQELYQVQAKQDDIDIQLISVGKYSFIPTTKILEITNGKYNCKLLAVLIPKNDLENDCKCMISFFISKKKKQDKVLSTFSFCYISSEKCFGICLNKSDKIEIIERYNKYPGNEQSIYLLTEIIVRKDVKKKIFN